MTEQEFNQLPVNEQRVAVAQDIIDALSKKKYIANSGRYFDTYRLKGRIISQLDMYWGHNPTEGSLDIKSNIEELEECKVCAVGACILSVTKFKNKLKFSDLGAVNSQIKSVTDEVLTSVFTPEQVLTMEYCFEGKGSSMDDRYGSDRLNATLEKDVIEKCDAFCEKYEDVNVRLTAIMQNLIDNKGEIVLN